MSSQDSLKSPEQLTESNAWTLARIAKLNAKNTNSEIKHDLDASNAKALQLIINNPKKFGVVVIHIEKGNLADPLKDKKVKNNDIYDINWENDTFSIRENQGLRFEDLIVKPIPKSHIESGIIGAAVGSIATIGVMLSPVGKQIEEGIRSFQNPGINVAMNDDYLRDTDQIRSSENGAISVERLPDRFSRIDKLLTQATSNGDIPSDNTEGGGFNIDPLIIDVKDLPSGFKKYLQELYPNSALHSVTAHTDSPVDFKAQYRNGIVITMRGDNELFKDSLRDTQKSLVSKIIDKASLNSTTEMMYVLPHLLKDAKTSTLLLGETFYFRNIGDVNGDPIFSKIPKYTVVVLNPNNLEGATTYNLLTGNTTPLNSTFAEKLIETTKGKDVTIPKLNESENYYPVSIRDYVKNLTLTPTSGLNADMEVVVTVNPSERPESPSIFFAQIRPGELIKLKDITTSDGVTYPKLGIIFTPTPEEVVYLTHNNVNKLPERQSKQKEVLKFMLRDGLLTNPPGKIYEASLNDGSRERVAVVGKNIKGFLKLDLVILDSDGKNGKSQFTLDLNPQDGSINVGDMMSDIDPRTQNELQRIINEE